MKKWLSCFLCSLLLLSLVCACALNEPAKENPGDTENTGNTEVIPPEKAMVLNMHTRNMLISGNEIIQNVIASYKPVTDFYGTDSALFNKLVKANLSTITESVSNLQSNPTLFYLEILDQVPDATIRIEYKNGTIEEMSVADFRSKIKDPTFTDKLKGIVNTLKILGDMPSLDDFNEKLNKINDTFTKLEEGLPIKKMGLGVIDALQSDQVQSAYSSLFTIASAVSGICSFVSVGLQLGTMLGVFDAGQDPTQVKLDYIIDMLEVMMEHLKFIEAKLQEIENKIDIVELNDFSFRLSEEINEINSFLSAFTNAISNENKKKTAEQINIWINGKMANFIDYAKEVTRLRINIIKWEDQNHTILTDEYKNFVLHFYMQYNDNFYYYHKTIQYDQGGGHPVYSNSGNVPEAYTYRLARVILENPNTTIPMDYSQLLFLQNMLITRMNMNSFIESEENIDEFNSNIARNYLTDNHFIPEIKGDINTNFIRFKNDLDQALSALENSKANMRLIAQHMGVTNWTFNAKLFKNVCGQDGCYTTYGVNQFYKSHTITPVNCFSEINEKWNNRVVPFVPQPIKAIDLMNQTWSGTYRVSSGYPSTANVTNPMLLLFDYPYNGSQLPSSPLPKMSADPYHMYEKDFPYGGQLTDAVYRFNQTLYKPRIRITPLSTSNSEIARNFGDTAAIDDVKALLVKTYRSKTSEHLELAALAAALEIYLQGYMIVE